MGNGPLTTEGIQVLFRDVIVPKVTKLYEQSAPFYKRFKEGTTIEVNDRGARIMNMIAPNPNMKWMDYNGGIFPAAGSQDYIDMFVFWTAFAISSGFTYATMLTKEVQALYDYVEGQLSQDKITINKEMERACWRSGDGGKAQILSVTSTGANGVVVMEPIMGGTQLLKNGLYSFYSQGITERTGGTAGGTLSSVASDNVTCTFTNVPTDVVPGDIVTFSGSGGRAIHGIPYHVSSDGGPYQGQSRTVYRTELTATENDLQGRMLSVAAIQNAMTANTYKMGTDDQKDSFEIWASPAQIERYQSLGYSMFRADMGRDSFNGAYKDLPENGKSKFHKSVDIRDDEVYGLDFESLKWFTLQALTIIQPDNQIMRLIPAFTVSGQTVTGSYAAKVQVLSGLAGDMGCTDPRVNWKISNVGTTNLQTRVGSL